MNLKLKLLADFYIGGVVHVLLKPFVILAGKILRRNHSLERCREITFFKFLGGGSLIIAYPSLLALKSLYPGTRLRLVTTPSILAFAEMTNLFDEIILIRDQGLIPLFLDSIRAMARLWRAQVIVDLELHSRFSSVFSLLTCAINRVGIYTEVSFWRRSLYTHLLFYNKISPIYLLYDQIAQLFGVSDINFARARNVFAGNVLQESQESPGNGQKAIGIAPGCSDYGRERMLSPAQWKIVLTRDLALDTTVPIHVLGGPKDLRFAEQLISELQSSFTNATFMNYCGKFGLRESISHLSSLGRLYAIDSSLIHFARLLNIETISFWGPTDPQSRLRPDPSLKERQHYGQISCSPCIHIALEAPCYGKNICMAAAVAEHEVPSNPVWLARD